MKTGRNLYARTRVHATKVRSGLRTLRARLRASVNVLRGRPTIANLGIFGPLLLDPKSSHVLIACCQFHQSGTAFRIDVTTTDDYFDDKENS